jgi:very-short-patch-repair endonuclease
MEAFENDRLRDNAAQLAGWRILRFTWEEITNSPERVVSTVARALED